MKSRKSNRKLILLAAIALCFLALYPFSFAEESLLWRRIFDGGHYLLFLLLAIAIHSSIKDKRRAFISTVIICLALCAAIEFLQPLSGRTTSAADIKNGLLGIFAGICLAIAIKEKQKRLIKQALLLILILFAAHAFRPAWNVVLALRANTLPSLANFEHAEELVFWQGINDEQLMQATTFANSGSSSLRVLSTRDEWTGAEFKTPQRNWSKRKAFSFSFYSPHNSFPLMLRIDDNEDCSKYHQRFNRKISLKKGWHNISIPLSEIETGPRERKLNLEHISRVLFFTSGEQELHSFLIDSLSLD